MKKIRLIVKISSGILVILLIAGIILQLTNENSPNDTAYEIIGFSVGIIGMIIALVAIVSSEKQERDFDKLERNVKDILEAEQADLKLSQKILNEVRPKKK